MHPALRRVLSFQGAFTHPPNPHLIMAITLSTNYSKKLGLPQFSSHSFSASVAVELTDLSQVEAEVQRLYELLQHSVDQEIQNPGFVPVSHGQSAHGNGRSHPINGNSNGNGNTRSRAYANSNGNSNGSGNGATAPRSADSWNCTEGQRGFILRIINENQLDKQDVEDLSQHLFQSGVKHLNKMQASQLIEELLGKAGKAAGRSRWSRTQPQANAA